MKIYKPLVGLLMLLICFCLMNTARTKFYEPSMQQKKELEEEIELNNLQIEALKDYQYVDKEGAKEAIKELQKDQEDWLGGFHGLYKDEDVILYVKDTQEDRGTDIFEISLGDSSPVTRLGKSYTLSIRPLTFDYETSYGGFKRYVEYITSKYPQTSIGTLTMNYEKETKNIKGTFSVILYYVEKEDYQSPDTIVDHGIDNIFEAEGRIN